MLARAEISTDVLLRWFTLDCQTLASSHRRPGVVAVARNAAALEVFVLVRTLRLLQTVVVVLSTVSHCEAISKSLGLEGVVRVSATNNADKL